MSDARENDWPERQPLDAALADLEREFRYFESAVRRGTANRELVAKKHAAQRH